ncbi:MAG TPA: DUF4011 domain-containing protein [Chloroflexota bacterium]|nr:DUF4011 domain-containing protein [Chloroflexota bacterium]
MVKDPLDARFDQWEKELLDLSKRNPLIHCRPSQRLTVRSPETAALYRGLVNGSPTSERKYTVYVPAAPAQSSRIELAPASPPPTEGRRNGEVAAVASLTYARLELAVGHRGRNEIVFDGDRVTIEQRLYRLRQRARTAQQEYGVNALFMGFGLLESREAPESTEVLTSPLFLIPVQLDRLSALQPYEIRPSDDRPALNPALARLFELRYHISLPLPSDEEERDLALADLLGRVRGALAPLAVPSVVKAEAFLGLFSFHKFAMYEDLRRHRERFKQHPCIRVVAGVENIQQRLPTDLPGEQALDAVLSPRDVFQVLDADASQQRALLAIRKGQSLVIQGPPGTGKSQTIANAIAEALADGKKVLFVSEKRAALEVVAKRLREVKLDEFILEIHSDKADKKTVVEQLHRALWATDRVPVDGVSSVLERLYQRREQLNAYVRALHDSNNPLGRSVYWVHGELARLHEAANMPFDYPAIATLTSEHLERLRAIVNRLARVGQALQAGERHPWYGCRVQQTDPHVQNRVEDWLTRWREYAERLARAQDAVRKEWQLPAGTSLADAEWLAQLLELLDAREPVPPHWLTVPTLEPYQTRAQQWEQWAAAYYQRRHALEEVYDERLFYRDLAGLRAGLTVLDDWPVRLMPGGASLAESALAHRRLLADTLPRFRAALQELDEEVAVVAAALGLEWTATVAEARRLLTIGRLAARDPRPLDAWVDPQRLAEVEALAEEAARQQAVVAELRPLLEDCFDEPFFELAASELGATFEQRYASWFRWLRPGYHRDLGRVRQTTRRPLDLGYPQVAEALRRARRVLAAERWLADSRRELAAGLGPHYQGPRTDWGAVRQALHTTRELLAQFERGQLPPDLVARLGQPETADRVRRRVESLAAAIEAVEGLHRALAPYVTLEALLGRGRGWDQVPCKELRGYLETWYDALQHLWQAADDVQGLRRQPASLPTLRADIESAIQVKRVEAEVAATEAELQEHFGTLYTGLATDWPRVQRALRWTERLRGHFGGAVPEGFVRAFAAAPPLTTPAREEFTVAREGLATALRGLSDWFAVPPEAARAVWERRPLAELASWAVEQHAQLRRLEEWVVLQHALHDAAAEGLTPFVEALRTTKHPPACWEDAFCRQMYSQWLAWRYQETPALAHFYRDAHERVLEEFRRLDREQFKLAARRIASRLREQRPQPGLEVHPQSEPAVLQREVTKQRRLLPLRRLFARIPTLLLELKPCLLMSPLSVAQYLGEIDPPRQFDLVLFDEASQIVPADAIGAIGRGKQVVVVGDNKQLPPTRFFVRNIDEEETEESDDESLPESVLDACSRCFPSVMLRWHYRSRHEELIACSNRWFYDSQLITFPSPAADTRAVEYIYVPDGVYDRGGSRKNRREAARVVELVVEHVTHDPKLSLGVVTLSESQMEEVLSQLEQRKRERPELEALLREEGAEGFFVKNLENVQGDERDVIILSIGYGPDANGRFVYNFGPVTQEGGERRLNVAITRARERVQVVASFRPEQLELNRLTKEGAKLLRQYLEFAQRGPAVLSAPLTSEGGEPESPFEEAVADALRARGLTVVSQVGIGPYRIDLAIKDEAGRYVLGIECDGATYHSAPTARDRDRLRQEVLERLGWRLHRIWSTNWLKDPAGEVQRVLAALDRARSGRPAVTPTPRAAPPEPVPSDPASGTQPLERLGAATPQDPPYSREAGSSSAAGARPLVQPYTQVTLPAQGSSDALLRERLEHLATLVHRCVQVEGPVHEDRVFEAIARSYQANRTQAVRGRLRRAVAVAVRRGLVAQRGPFLWPPGVAVPPVRGATARGEVRPIEHVSPEEIGEACRVVLRANFSLPREALVQEVASVLGYQRAGKNIREAVQAVIRDLVERGDLREVGGQLSVAERRAP